jgi:hypothetical protein
MKDALKTVLDERDAEKEIKTLAMSGVTQSGLQTYLSSLNQVVVTDEYVSTPSRSSNFDPFEWKQGEKEDTTRAMCHICDQLSKFGVEFGYKKYELYDVHDRRTILNVDDPKCGKLKGGTDVIIAPCGLANESIVKQACVLFELKTAHIVSTNKLDSFNPQATLELIAANYHSNQLVLVVLTDLYTAANMITFNLEKEELVITRYSNVSLNGMANFISGHLSQNCFNNRAYKFDHVLTESMEEKKSEMIVKCLKKARVSDVHHTLAWEHFEEMMEDYPIGSSVRAKAIQDHFRSFNLPESNYLSMYS